MMLFKQYLKNTARIEMNVNYDNFVMSNLVTGNISEKVNVKLKIFFIVFFYLKYYTIYYFYTYLTFIVLV